MMKLSIKNRFTGSIIFEYEKESNTIKETVEKMLLEFKGKWIEKVDLSGFDLSNIDFSNSKFYNSQFDNSKFYNSQFDNSKFYNSQFYNSQFYNSKFYNSKFYNSKFDNSQFDNSQFYNSKFDNQTILNIRSNNQLGMFDSYKFDLWGKLIKLKNEIPAFVDKIKVGEIDGSCYEGICCCFVGTFANIKKTHYKQLEGIYPDSNSPTERWFMLISKGMTPENSEIVKLTLEWIEEFEFHLKCN